MKKLFTVVILSICVSYTARAQEDLGTPGITMDPTLAPMFQNDLPVIKELGLRVDLTQEKTSKIRVSMEQTTQDLLGLGYLNDGIQSIAVPVGHLVNGMYILELKTGDRQYRESIFISK
jgi:hypothetical protein